MRCVVACLLLCSALAHAEDSPVAVLTAIRDAQRSHASHYPEGILDAHCSDLNHGMKVHSTADVHLEWQAESAYWKYTYHQTDPKTGQPKYKSFIDCELVRTSTQSFYFFPEGKYFCSSPVDKFSLLDPMLDLRPAKLWYTMLPLITGNTWADTIQTSLDSKATLDVDQSDAGLVTWSTASKDGTVSTVVFDLGLGANVVSLELNPDPGSGGVGFQASFSWIDDGHGSFRLKNYAGTEFMGSLDHAVRQVEIDIFKFNSQPQFAAGRFTRGSIPLPPKTRVETYDATPGSHPKVSHFGGVEKPRISEGDLEKLSNGLKEDGSSNPSRHTKPR